MVVHEKKLTSNQRKAVQHSCRMTIIYALLQDRRFDAGYVLLGTVFIGEKKRERARQCFLKALSINPKNAGAPAFLGFIERAFKKHCLARSLFFSPMKTVPSNT